MSTRMMRCFSIVLTCLAFAIDAASAQSIPGEVGDLYLAASHTLSWPALSGADDYNVYRGDLSRAAILDGAACHGDEIVSLSFATQPNPAAGRGFFYLVTAENAIGEGTPGAGAAGPRALRGSCDATIRGHLLNRIGFGGDEWSRARIALLGLQVYIDEQLNPAGIDESGNTALITRATPLTPPADNFELAGLEVVQGVYSRRQLEHQMTMFWTNHLNTDYRKIFMFFGFYPYITRALESAKLHYDERNLFRDLAFNGTFREMIEASALSPAMILYLDTETNIAGEPNENFARELLELHTMGVDGGYLQQDIVELARVFTGWNVCKKKTNDISDPLAPCLPTQHDGTPSNTPGAWVGNFRLGLHDHGAKVLFASTPWEATIPGTSANPQAGVDDVGLALNAIAAHPATSHFIARKLLARFVMESPTQAMVDAVAAEWADSTNPLGVGDLREVLRATLAQAAFLSPDQAGAKIKSPLEQIVSGFRAARGKTNGIFAVRDYLIRMGEVPHENPIPTGYPESGGDWIDTNNLLERQNFGIDTTARSDSYYGADVIALANDSGISTAPLPDNSAAIVDFFGGVLFSGALAPSERQRAIAYLTTDDEGSPAPYDDTRIRETLGFMMGFARFLQQ